MTRARLSSSRKFAVLRLARELVGKTFDLDVDIAFRLGLSHDIASETLGKLKRGGYLEYDHWQGMDGRPAYRMVAVNFPLYDDAQPLLF